MTSEATYTPTPPPAEWENRTTPDGQLNDKCGIEVIDFNPARVVATMPVAGNLQPYGLMHGGASAVLAEAVGSTAAVLNSEPGTVSVGTQIIATHHRAVRSGVVTAVATPLHVGRTLKTFRVDITDEDGKLVCTAQLSAMTMPQAPGA
ncbi:hotdog fold thioesterase [Epidermidibacterium keratini]|uniref:Hotdog fold thioesterase n=1 Tax=Epidermidibacterium keratini TaxID=1891644 RepID=A0A7L4YJR8_9ACTN|nr:hotdog fold thioesterase [Epidermidibacterium keratini]QHB99093.1 hotdog fold thioesterase [Epidermidibacterium keratini]